MIIDLADKFKSKNDQLLDG